MKKVLIASLFFLGFTSATNAQTVKKTTPAKTTEMKVVKATEPKPAPVVKMKTETTTSGVKLKADGTPDKRYKKTKTASGHLKKDGTPDKRYKANKK